MLIRTLSVDEKIKYFGDYRPFCNEEGIPSIFWEEDILTTIALPAPLPLSYNKAKDVSNIRCHKKIAGFLLSALNEIYQDKEVWDTINDYGGCYNFRSQRKSKTLSAHCWAIAIDLDVGDNPFSATPKVHPKVVDIFNNHGFIWGGLFPKGRIDGMHFEFYDIRKLS